MLQVGDADDHPDPPPARARRPRYPGTNPCVFHQKYKELNPDRYPEAVERVLASGKTPAGSHRPIMVDEVLECLRPAPGDVGRPFTTLPLASMTRNAGSSWVTQ